MVHAMFLNGIQLYEEWEHVDIVGEATAWPVEDLGHLNQHTPL